MNRTAVTYVSRVLGTELTFSENFPPDDTAHGFDNVAAALSMTDVTLGYYIDAAKKLAAEALSPAKRSSFVSCDLATGKETCVTAALSSFLPRAWRRSVQADEVRAPAHRTDSGPAFDLSRAQPWAARALARAFHHSRPISMIIGRMLRKMIAKITSSKRFFTISVSAKM